MHDFPFEMFFPNKLQALQITVLLPEETMPKLSLSLLTRTRMVTFHKKKRLFL